MVKVTDTPEQDGEYIDEESFIVAEMFLGLSFKFNDDQYDYSLVVGETDGSAYRTGTLHGEPRDGSEVEGFDMPVKMQVLQGSGEILEGERYSFVLDDSNGSTEFQTSAIENLRVWDPDDATDANLPDPTSA